jgi:heme-degrading monooxygenase HmoA
VIARVWRGCTTAENARAYGRHFTGRVRPELACIPGHRGALLLRRELAGAAKFEFLVVTTWDSMDAVKAFAGPDPERAVVEPAARAVLSEFDESVRHYEVVTSRASAAPRRRRGSPRRRSRP